MKTAGHNEAHGGLRSHSIGDHYPFVVYNVCGDQWRITDPHGYDIDRQFTKARNANRVAAQLKQCWLEESEV